MIPINFSLKSELEKDAILNSYKLFLKTFNVDLQILIQSKKEDLSNCATTEEFYDLFEKVAQNGYDLLEKGRFACLIIGDKYANSQHIPLGFECMARMNKLGFITKAIIIKDMQGNERAKGKTANLWRYRALAGGFYIFKHEYVMVFQKV